MVCDCILMSGEVAGMLLSGQDPTSVMVPALSLLAAMAFACQGAGSKKDRTA